MYFLLECQILELFKTPKGSEWLKKCCWILVSGVENQASDWKSGVRLGIEILYMVEKISLSLSQLSKLTNHIQI